MRRLPPLLLSQAWGTACGAFLGAVYTRAAALDLLAKNRALEAAGIPALPGPGHLDTLASWAPAAAGALFFGLSLGLGWGTLLGLWARLSRAVPGRFGRWCPWACLAIPLWVLCEGDLRLAAAALVAAAASSALATQRPQLPPSRAIGGMALALLIAAGLSPWASAPESPFTRLRDRYLLRSAAGLAVDELYYRWTLYPAEAIKPLASKTQPVVVPSESVVPSKRAAFCNSALRLGILCLPPGAPAAEARLETGDGGLLLTRGSSSRRWPAEASAQRSAWDELSGATDAARPLRRATAIGLLAGCPLALCWALAAVATRVASVVPGERLRWAAAFAAAGVLAALLALAGLPYSSAAEVRRLARGVTPPSLAAVASSLRSTDPVERFYAAEAAGKVGPGAAPLLTEALSDPVINVRYAAAISLGSIRETRSRVVLLEILRNPEEWYVKERAYAALWRLGWRPY